MTEEKDNKQTAEKKQQSPRALRAGRWQPARNLSAIPFSEITEIEFISQEIALGNYIAFHHKGVHYYGEGYWKNDKFIHWFDELPPGNPEQYTKEELWQFDRALQARDAKAALEAGHKMYGCMHPWGYNFYYDIADTETEAVEHFLVAPIFGGKTIAEIVDDPSFDYD